MLTLNGPQTAAAKKSDLEQTIALCTLKVSPRQVMVKSEPRPEDRSLEVVSMSGVALVLPFHLLRVPHHQLNLAHIGKVNLTIGWMWQSFRMV